MRKVVELNYLKIVEQPHKDCVSTTSGGEYMLYNPLKSVKFENLTTVIKIAYGSDKWLETLSINLLNNKKLDNQLYVGLISYKKIITKTKGKIKRKKLDMCSKQIKFCKSHILYCFSNKRIFPVVNVIVGNPFKSSFKGVIL